MATGVTARRDYCWGSQKPFTSAAAERGLERSCIVGWIIPNSATQEAGVVMNTAVL